MELIERVPPIRPRAVNPFPVERLPQLLRRDVERLRHFARFLSFAPHGGVQIEAAAAVAPESVPVSGLCIELRRAERRLALYVDARAAVKEARRLLGLPPDELAATRPPTLAEEGALELLLATLLRDAQVERIVDARGRSRRSTAEHFFVQLTVRLADGTRTVVTVEVPLALELVAPPQVASAPTDPRSVARLSALLVHTWIELGRTRLAAAELRSLAARDVVLFDQLVRDVRGGPVQLRFGHGAFAARLDGETLVVEDFFRLYGGGHAMSDEQTAAGTQTEPTGAPHADQLLHELSVEVVCELGRVSMSGRDLVELRPGAVITAGRPLSGPVDLTVGGRLVARGELVDVEGEIGVRVTQLMD